LQPDPRSVIAASVSRPLAERWLVPFLLLNIAAVVLTYVWLLVPVLRDGGYQPAWTDEYGYVLDARSFAQNGTLHAARVKEEGVSRLFEASTHCPAYILLQGGLALFADPVALSVWPNLVVLGISFLLILLYPVPLAQRLWIVLLLLLHFAVFLYAFTWMVETYQLLFAVGASLLGFFGQIALLGIISYLFVATAVISGVFALNSLSASNEHFAKYLTSSQRSTTKLCAIVGFIIAALTVAGVPLRLFYGF
jgi:hypothetical protein